MPLENHFKNKEKAKDLYDYLVKEINTNIGKCKIISIPCCVHIFGTYDFLAVLPKKDRLEIRFAFDCEIDSPRIKTSVPMSKKVYKNCLDIFSQKEIDTELMEWVNRSYHLKD
ncbi:DUF5655 domain-containing protein [Patescibacteria group bacterium]